MSSIEIGDFDLLSSFLYINIGNTKRHFSIKLILVITNHKKKSQNKDLNILILIYKNNGYLVFLNN